MLLDGLLLAIGLPAPGALARVLLAAFAAFAAAIVFGRPYVAWLRRQGVNDGESIKASDTLQKLHADAGKARTPTMGGPIILAGVLAAAVLAGPLDDAVLWIGLGLVAALGAIGMYDDVRKLKRVEGRDGMRARTKLLLQLAIGATAGILLAEAQAGLASRTLLIIPFIDGAAIDLGIFAIPFTMLVIVGASNAVNFTDGLDGLASGVSVGIAAVLALFALFAGGAIVLHTTGATEAISAATSSAASIGLPEGDMLAVSVLAAGLVGGLLGFLWFNAPPADVFMGDTGSLPLGGLLGFLACSAKFEFVFIVVAGIPVLEVLSVILQVASFKLTGKRIFRCSPIHHHFQFAGMAETKIVVRFWIVTAVLAGAGMFALAVG